MSPISKYDNVRSTYMIYGKTKVVLGVIPSIYEIFITAFYGYQAKQIHIQIYTYQFRLSAINRFELFAKWLHDMETFPHNGPFVGRIDQSLLESPHNWRVVGNFDVFSDASKNKLLNKQSRCRWLNIMSLTKHHCNGSAIVMWTNMYLWNIVTKGHHNTRADPGFGYCGGANGFGNLNWKPGGWGWGVGGGMRGGFGVGGDMGVDCINICKIINISQIRYISKYTFSMQCSIS